MKLKIFILMLCVCVFDVVAQEPAKDSLGYYERMSGMAFATIGDLYKLETDPVKKLYVAKDMSYMSFTYWAYTRVGGLTQSKLVDQCVQRIYRSCFRKEADFSARLQEVFYDPCEWLKSGVVKADKPGLSLPEPLAKYSKAQYIETLKEYKLFLEAAVTKQEKP